LQKKIVITTHVSGDLKDKVEIFFKDTGTGIVQEALHKSFDPFYTTKEVGKGTGLGLSISYGIIQNHKGEIDVAKTGPEGTTFRIRLPVA
jgi:signal transduction histidine kinase